MVRQRPRERLSTGEGFSFISGLAVIMTRSTALGILPHSRRSRKQIRNGVHNTVMFYGVEHGPFNNEVQHLIWMTAR